MRPTARHTRLLGESLQVAVGQAFAVIGSLLLVRTLSEHLLPADYGVLALGLTGSLLVSQAISGGTTAAIGRYYSPAQEVGSLRFYLRASARILRRDQGLITVLTAAVALLLAVALGLPWAWLALGAGCVALTSSWSTALVAVLNGGRHRLAASGFMALDPWLKLLFLSVCLRWMPAGPASILFIFGFSTGLLTLVADLLMQLCLGFRVRDGFQQAEAETIHWLRQMRAFRRPFTRFGVVTWLQQASDRWALQAWAGAASVGQYAVIYQLGYSPVGILSNVLNNFLAPILYGRAGDASSKARNQTVHQLVRRLALVGLLLSAGAFAAAYLAHRWLFGLLVAPAYRDFSIWFPWLVLAGSLLAVGQLIALKLMSDNRTVELGRVKTLSALLGVLLNVLGAAKYGIAGVVMAQNLFSLIYLLWMIHLGLRVSEPLGVAHG